MQNFKADDLEIKIEKGSTPVMLWLGISNAREPALAINPFVDGFLRDLKSREIIVDFRKLEYMNSSTVTPIIRLIRELDKKNIKTTIIYKRISKWQQASFKALDTLSKMLTNVTVEGR